MARINHNGLDVDTDEEVDAAYETLVRVKDEYGLKEIRTPAITHGDDCFYFVDLDANWWEIVKTRPGLGHAEDFTDAERDLTGRGHARSEEHTSDLQSLMRSSYAVHCLEKKRNEAQE